MSERKADRWCRARRAREGAPDEDDPLLKPDNVVLSAHALNWTDNLDSRLAESNMEAVLAVAERRDPEGVVNREVMKTTIWRDKLTRLRVISSKP